MISFGVRLETRTNPEGAEELRVVADAAWDESLELGGYQTATMASDWFRRDLAKRSPIAEFVEALESTNSAIRAPTRVK